MRPFDLRSYFITSQFDTLREYILHNEIETSSFIKSTKINKIIIIYNNNNIQAHKGL